MATIDTRLLLLIDDEPAQGRLISALAAREGFRTIVAGTAATSVSLQTVAEIYAAVCVVLALVAVAGVRRNHRSLRLAGADLTEPAQPVAA